MTERIVVVYYINSIPNLWTNIAIMQLDGLKSCGLYKKAHEIYISVCAKNSELTILEKLIKKYYSKIKLVNLYSRNVFEYPGIKTLYEISQRYSDDKTYILYFHSRDNIHEDFNLQLTLFNHTIKNHKCIVNKFKENPDIDIISAIPSCIGFAWFNYFWVKSSYVTKHCEKPQICQDQSKWESEWLVNTESPIKKDWAVTWSPVMKYSRSNDPLLHISQLQENWNFQYDKYYIDDDEEILFVEPETIWIYELDRKRIKIKAVKIYNRNLITHYSKPKLNTLPELSDEYERKMKSDKPITPKKTFLLSIWSFVFQQKVKTV